MLFAAGKGWPNSTAIIGDDDDISAFVPCLFTICCCNVSTSAQQHAVFGIVGSSSDETLASQDATRSASPRPGGYRRLRYNIRRSALAADMQKRKIMRWPDYYCWASWLMNVPYRRLLLLNDDGRSTFEMRR